MNALLSVCRGVRLPVDVCVHVAQFLPGAQA